MMPAEARPATARPTIKTTEFGAAPQIAEPTAKIRTDNIKVILMLKKVYSLPKSS